MKPNLDPVTRNPPPVTSRAPEERAPRSVEELEALNADLVRQVQEAAETISAIQKGAVDAFVMEEADSHRVYTLQGADRPYRIFVEEMQQGVATLHGDGTVIYCNRRLAELLQIAHEKLVGTALLDFVVAEDRSVYKDLLRRAPSGSGRGEARLQRTDGGLIPAYLTFSELPPDSGAMTGVFVTDLTSEKNHQQLAIAQQALREADRRKDEFLAMLAHELRNPLAPIRNAISILRQRGGEAVQETCGMLERQVSLMVRLVDDLVDISRITRNKIELRKERVEIAAVVEQAVECARPICNSLGHEITVRLPEEPVVLEGDPIRLTQVFANLLDNACKYMERGGRIWLTAEVTSPREGAGEVAVRVRDQGIGIAPDQLSRIFDMFAQVDTSLERAKSGLGIGLTLVKSLVELHGGTIEARSEGPGKGSEFVVRLPVPAGPAPKRAPEKKTVPQTRSYRILVADDNRDSANSLALLLKLMGHETHTAMDGIEAVEAAQRLNPDVVLLDIGMPRMNGYDACRRIREQPWSRSMMLIAQTGWGQEEDRRRTEEAGFHGHLTKPVDPDVLLKLVASLSAPAER